MLARLEGALRKLRDDVLHPPENSRLTRHEDLIDPALAEPLVGRTLQALQHRLAGHVQAALGVTLAPHDIILEIPEPSAPPIDIGYVDAAFSLISPVIPMSVFRPAIERSLLRKSRWETGKNLSRLASNWRDRVAKGSSELTRQAEQQALDELAALEHTVAQTASKAPELRQPIEELEQFQERLHG